MKRIMKIKNYTNFGTCLGIFLILFLMVAMSFDLGEIQEAYVITWGLVLSPLIIMGIPFILGFIGGYIFKESNIRRR